MVLNGLSFVWQVKLSFSPEALRAISKQAMEKKTGARGLRAILVHFNHSITNEFYTSTNMPSMFLRNLYS